MATSTVVVATDWDEIRTYLGNILDTYNSGIKELRTKIDDARADFSDEMSNVARDFEYLEEILARYPGLDEVEVGSYDGVIASEIEEIRGIVDEIRQGMEDTDRFRVDGIPEENIDAEDLGKVYVKTPMPPKAPYAERLEQAIGRALKGHETYRQLAVTDQPLTFAERERALRKSVWYAKIWQALLTKQAEDRLREQMLRAYDKQIAANPRYYNEMATMGVSPRDADAPF